MVINMWKYNIDTKLSEKQSDKLLSKIKELHVGDPVQYYGATYKVVKPLERFKYSSNMVIYHETTGYTVVADTDLLNLKPIT